MVHILSFSTSYACKLHELQLSSANTGWAPVFLQTNEITFPQHCTRAAEGRRGNGERRLSSGEGGRRRWDGGKRWSTCFADFSPRSTFKSAHSMRRRISSRRRLECEMERATGFIIEIAGFRAISRGSRTSTFQMFRVQPWKVLSGRITKLGSHAPRHLRFVPYS